MFSGQAFVNMGVSSGLLPTKGLTLPLVSYGGSSVITSCALLGMVLRVAAELDAPVPAKASGRGKARASGKASGKTPSAAGAVA